MNKTSAGTSILTLLILTATAFFAMAIFTEDAHAVQPNPFKEPISRAISFFKAFEGTVVEVDGDQASASASESAVLLKGMRMRVFRKGKPFTHPVTREVIVQSETPVGLAEVIDPDRAKLRKISGQMEPDDLLRISSGTVRAMFFQDTSVEWDVAEEYFFWLKDTGRFALADTAPGRADPQIISSTARDMGADVVIALSMGGTPAQPKLKQTLIWALDGSVFSEEEFTVELAKIRTLKLGQEYFAPRFDKPIAEHPISHNSELIAAGDVDGDGADEIIVTAGSSLYLYKAEESLSPAFGQEEDVVITSKLGTRYVWLEATDINHDGDAEILVTGLVNNTLRSKIYDHTDKGFTTLWEGSGFIRSINGTVYEQSKDFLGRFLGSPRPLAWEQGSREPESSKVLPPGLNIYNIAILKPQGLARHYTSFDRKGYLGITNSGGGEIWKSSKSWGGFTRKFGRTATDNKHTDDIWMVNDRLLSKGNSVFTFKRFGNLGNVKGMGYKETRLMGVFIDAEGKVHEAELIKDMRGSAMDFAISGNRLYLLTGSFKINLANVFKGKHLFTSRLYIYKLMGE